MINMESWWKRATRNISLNNKKKWYKNFYSNEFIQSIIKPKCLNLNHFMNSILKIFTIRTYFGYCCTKKYIDRDQKTAKEGFIIFVAGPKRPKVKLFQIYRWWYVFSSLILLLLSSSTKLSNANLLKLQEPPQRRRFPNLMDLQMTDLNEESVAYKFRFDSYQKLLKMCK